MRSSYLQRLRHGLRHARQAGMGPRARRRRQIVLEALEDRITLSLTPQMVLDINPNTPSSNPSEMVAIGSTTYFTADDGVHGTELWRSDGTAAGTVMVKDINPGSSCPNPPATSTNVNGTLFFAATTASTGRSCGRATAPPPAPSWSRTSPPAAPALGPGDLTNVNGTLFFAANDGTSGRELWRSDGTAAGTVLVKDIRPGISAITSSALTPAPDERQRHAVLRGQRWQTGTSCGRATAPPPAPSSVKDILDSTPGSDSEQLCPGNLTNVNGTLFFAANDGTQRTGAVEERRHRRRHRPRQGHPPRQRRS